MIGVKHLLATIAALSLAVISAQAAQSQFVGTWKPNRGKAQVDANADSIKIEADGKNGIRYMSGPVAVYGGALDGSERPGLGSYGKDTFKLEKVGDRGFRTTQSRNGKPTVTELIEVSPDGMILTSSMHSFAPRPDGKPQPTNLFTFERAGEGGKPYPFVGTWKRNRRLTKWGEEAVPMIISETAAGVLTMASATADGKTVVDLNRSSMTLAGAANPAPDVTRSAKRIDATAFETTAIRGTRKSTSLYRLSPDGKELTIRVTVSGDDGKPVAGTTFYDRQ